LIICKKGPTVTTITKKTAPAKSRRTAVPTPALHRVKAGAVAPLPVTKVVVKVAGKPPVPKSVSVSGPVVELLGKPESEKPAKVKRPKLVRDSFTIPKTEYAVLDELKQRAVKLGRPSKKSELLRAGIKALAAMSGGAFLTALQSVPTIKTGRPGRD
jgi:hypothetical protein